MYVWHRAYLFDWDAFRIRLLPVLEAALQTDNRECLSGFVDANWASMRDPYFGRSLCGNWRSMLDVGDVQETADFALAKYYDPVSDFGLGSSWVPLCERLPDEIGEALLGDTVGSPSRSFDSGGAGAYFQSTATATATKSLDVLSRLELPEIHGYRLLVAYAVRKRRGVYVRL